MSKHDALYIAKFQKRNRRAKNVKPRKARKAIRAAMHHYEGMFARFWPK